MGEEEKTNSPQQADGEAEVVFNESYDAEEVESVIIPDANDDYVDEDEDVSEDSGITQSVLSEHTQADQDHGKKDYGLGLTAMILGILSILLMCVPIISLVLAVVALILGIVASAKNNGKKMGVSGIVMGSIILLTYLVVIVFFGGIMGTIYKNQDRLTGTAWRRTEDGSVLYLYDDGTFIHAEQEGVFSDNFYSGTYDILGYEDTGLHLSNLEKDYDTDYIYDVYLHVDTYVYQGEERDNIASTIRYLFLFDKKYSDGDVINVCPHDMTELGALCPVRETKLMFPSIGNQYEATVALTDESVVDEVVDDSGSYEETEGSMEAATQTTDTEQTLPDGGDVDVGIAPPGIMITEVPADTATEGSEATGSSEADTVTDDQTFWNDLEDYIDDSKEQIDEFQSSVSEEFDQKSEEFDQAMEEASSAWDDAESAWDDATAADSDTTDGGWLQRLFQTLIDWLQSLF